MTLDSAHGAGTRRALVPGVRVAAALLGGLYAVLAVLHLVAAPRDARLALAVTAAATALVCAAGWLHTARRALPDRLAPHAAGVLASLAAANSLLHLALTGDPLQVTNLLLVIVAAGAVVDHLRWSVAIGAACVAGAGAVAVTSAPDPAWTHFGFGLLSASLLAVLLRRVRQSSLASLEAARLEAAEQATHDALTGLLNRRGLELVGDRALVAARRDRLPVVLLYVDLDGFKAVNDTLGHAAGDAVLVDAARRLAAAFREADAIGRIGGDEFALLLVGAVPEAGEMLAERARTCLSGVAASVGMTASHEPLAVSLAQLLDQADARMYAEKNAKQRRLPVQRELPPALR